MNNTEKVRAEIKNCLSEAKIIVKYLQGVHEDEKFSFHIEYQKWYSKVIKIVEFLAPDRFLEFKSYYEIDPKRKSLGYGTYSVQDYLKGVAPGSYHLQNFDAKQETMKNVYNQYSILSSINERLDNVLADIRTVLSTELHDIELATAKNLLKINIRAAGVICGVILESYLQNVIEKHKIKLAKRNPALSDLNESLKNSDVYDTVVWRKISYLSDIRNICAHKKDVEPTKDQVEELIEGTNWATKNIF